MRILVVAPHPDDESLGCGGTLSRFRREKPDEEIHWLIVTDMTSKYGFSNERIFERNSEIESVAKRLEPVRMHRLGLQPARLDTLSLGNLVSAIGKIITDIQPDTVFVPWRDDVHTDHRAVFDAMMACSKTFRYSSIRHVLAYETPSETDFSIDPVVSAFKPNVWIDISEDLDSKLELLMCYPSEIGMFPFPRSLEAVASLAKLRGSFANVKAAEAFVLLKSIF